MPQLKISRGVASALPTQKTDGNIYITTDTKKIYIDNGTTRFQINARYADSLKNKLKLILGGDATGEISFDGDEGSVTLNVTIEKLDELQNAINGIIEEVAALPNSASNGIKIENNTIKHTNSITAGSFTSPESNLSFTESFDIPNISYDAQGHITSVTASTFTLPAEPVIKLITGSKNTSTANAAVTSSTNKVYLNLTNDGSVVNSHLLQGSGEVKLSSNSSGTVTVNSPSLSSSGLISTTRNTTNNTITFNAPNIVSGDGISIVADETNNNLTVQAAVENGIVINTDDKIQLEEIHGTAETECGLTADTSGTNGTKINIPHLKVDQYGRVTLAENKVYTARDRYVTQTLVANSTTSAYPILLANTGLTATKTQGAYFNTQIKYTPSSNSLSTNISGNAGSATKLKNAQTFIVNLGSTDSASFNGSASATLGVSGTLPIGYGGTGATTAANAANNIMSRGTSNGDFNSKTSTGHMWTQLPSCSNTPNGYTTGYYGHLEVIRSAGAGVILQRWTNYLNGDTWVRSSNASTDSTSDWQSWSRYLDSNNFNNYAPKLDGTGAHGTWNIALNSNAGSSTKAIYFTGGLPKACNTNIAHNAKGLYGGTKLTSSTIDAFKENGVLKWATADSTAVGSNDGMVISLSYDATYAAQMWLDDGSNEGGMKIRNWNGSSGTWNPWRQVLTEYNYDSYALPLSGGTMTGVITRSYAGHSWINVSHGRFCGIKLATAASGGSASCLWSVKTNTGAWGCGGLSGKDNLYFVWGSDENYSAGTNTANSSIYFNSNGYIYSTRTYGAVWNDYAEYRNQKEIIKPGYCVTSSKNGQVAKTTKKMQYCEGIVSDTFGFSIGETDECKTPIAVSGRVLAYYSGNIEDYDIGDVVCAGPEGKVCKMSREEIREYPDRIIGTISEIPEYETWGTGNVPTKDRIWIKIR